MSNIARTSPFLMIFLSLAVSPARRASCPGHPTDNLSTLKASVKILQFVGKTNQTNLSK